MTAKSQVQRVAAAQTLISIITATRNAALELPALFGDLMAQSDREFEWIVQDGLSTDGTTPLVEYWAAEQPWIRPVSEADFGFYDALNRALRRARGGYYLVVGADDRLDPDAIRDFRLAAARSQADIVLAGVRAGNSIRRGFHPGRAWLGHPSAFRGSHSVGMLIRTSLHERHGYYSNRFPLLADGYFLKRLLADRTVRFSSEMFVAGSFGLGGMTSTRKAQILAETWQIQLLTERRVLLQTLLFIGKVLVRLPALIRESKRG